MNDHGVLKELEKYETYINEVLKTDLSKVCAQLNEVTTDLAEYKQLTQTIHLMQKFKENEKIYKTMMDIGCNFFMETRIDDLSHILLSIGSDCYLEFSLSEALQFIETKTKFLNDKLTMLRAKSAKIKAHIKLMLLIMNQLSSNNIKT